LVPRLLKVLIIMLGVLLLALIALWVSLPDVRHLASANPATTAMIDLRRRQATDAGKPFRLRWEWRPLGRISPLLQRAVIYAEDPVFFQHQGVDWEEIKEAAAHDWHTKSFERGASTITQQVAKNLYLSPSRNPIRKLREFAIAKRLDRDLSKSRVLEIYLNIAEWGDGVFGAEAAARHWFGCSAAQLDAAQAARLAVALPNPILRAPTVRSRQLARKAARLVRALRRAGLIDEAEADEGQRSLGIAPKGQAQAPEPEPPPEPEPDIGADTPPE
jgi:monofunctional biosynthetic peptidoglycan transglycosylase